MSLTPRQKEVFEYIETFIRRNGHSPSHQDLMKKFGWKSPGTVQDLLNALERRGYLSRENRTAHTLKVQESQRHLLLLGKVAAGLPIENFKHNERIEVPAAMMKGTGDYFVLQVSGDSMIDEGILDSDYVVVKKKSTAESGQIVIAVVNDGATLKRFYKRKNHIELHSANPRYPPLVVQPQEDFRIEGIYCGLLRYYS
jgi:repressor LexA